MFSFLLAPVELSRSLPNLNGSVLRPLSQHYLRLMDRFLDAIGFDDLTRLDVIGFVQEEAAVNVHVIYS